MDEIRPKEARSTNPFETRQDWGEIVGKTFVGKTVAVVVRYADGEVDLLPEDPFRLYR